MSNLDKFLKVKQTEKSSKLLSLNKHYFVFEKSLTKDQISSLIKKVFNVEVLKINVINYKPKKKKFKGVIGYKKGYKKAIITLKEGNSINLG
jgi:large subunit ribosomal protein L23